jgi:FAD/FMN-containing dehydrogenase
VSRFDPDGAVMFFTFETDEATSTVLEKVADTAGAWLLGARATKLDAYLRLLRDTLDPQRIMNPGTLS